MWYLGAALAFASGYLYYVNKAEALVLFAASLAVAYLGEHLSAQGKAKLYRRRAEQAETRLTRLHLEVEEERKKRQLLEQQLGDMRQELKKLRDMIPVEEKEREKIKRIISETPEEL
jgi:septal ring factor EnvC (AmiA/AmiB activator)